MVSIAPGAVTEHDFAPTAVRPPAFRYSANPEPTSDSRIAPFAAAASDTGAVAGPPVVVEGPRDEGVVPPADGFADDPHAVDATARLTPIMYRRDACKPFDIPER